MRTRLRFGTLCAAGLVVLGAGLLAVRIFAFPGRIADHLPADPMFAAVSTVHPAETIDRWVRRIEKLSGGGTDVWTELDQEVGMSFRDDVLGAFGPECALALDLPDVEAGETASFLDSSFLQGALDCSIFVAQVEDKGRAIRALTALAELAEAKVGIDGDLVTLALGSSSTSGDELTLYARLRRGLVVVSGSIERVDEAIDGFPQGSRLTDGSDFARVIPHVAADPDAMTYVNLPEIREWIRDAGILSDVGSGEMEFLLDDEWMGMGLVRTARRADDGVEIAQYGPGAASEGLWALWTGSHMAPALLMSQLAGAAAFPPRPAGPTNPNVDRRDP